MGCNASQQRENQFKGQQTLAALKDPINTANKGKRCIRQNKRGKLGRALRCNHPSEPAGKHQKANV